MTHVLAYMSAAALLVGMAWASSASGVRADDAIDAWARWAVAPKVWKGQVVLTPEPETRPALDLRLDSLELPVHVHAPAGVRDASATLAALERAYRDWLDAGWTLAPLDLYALRGLPASEARVDLLFSPAVFDTAQTFAVAPAGGSDAQREACVHSAFAQATVRALDPAEAPSWVRATGEWNAWRATGEPGCGDSLVLGQNAPERSMLGSDLAAAGSGALWLALLSERHGTEVVRALWELTRQRSKGLLPDDQLRGAPDLWQAIASVLESANERWPDAFEEFGIARFFAGEPSRRSAAAFRVFADLPSDAAVPLLADLDGTRLPERVRTAADGGIEPLGSVYARVRLAGDPICAARGCELRVWLRGELGPNWSLTALRLGADGRELGRTRAPARNVPSSYLPLAIAADTHDVILVVTHLPRELPDADRAVPSPHGVELSIDRVAVP